MQELHLVIKAKSKKRVLEMLGLTRFILGIRYETGCDQKDKDYEVWCGVWGKDEEAEKGKKKNESKGK